MVLSIDPYQYLKGNKSNLTKTYFTLHNNAVTEYLIILFLMHAIPDQTIANF